MKPESASSNMTNAATEPDDVSIDTHNPNLLLNATECTNGKNLLHLAGKSCLLV